jgi:hypothetical protein
MIGNTLVLPSGDNFTFADHGKACFESRIIGVRVVCGPVDSLFVYYTDNFIGSGANIMCEVLRRGMRDLAKRLRDQYNFSLPKDGFFQSDNGLEFKVSRAPFV